MGTRFTAGWFVSRVPGGGTPSHQELEMSQRFAEQLDLNYSDDAVVEVSVSERPRLVRVAVGGDVHEGRWSNNEEVVANEGDEGVLKAALTAWEGPNRFSLSWAELQGRGGGWV